MNPIPNSNNTPMENLIFDPNAHWLWPSTGNREYNSYVAFRRSFDITSSVVSARLRITADARYEVYVNGVWVGHGPPRSWPHIWSVDEYDLHHLLHPGRNVVAVLVTHYGLSTFQYIHADPGLIAQLDWTDTSRSHRLLTDAHWRCTPHNGFHYPVPRVSCQQGWEEQFDARQSPGLIEDWSSSAFNDSSWQTPALVRPAGAPPHEQFELRDIPALTRENIQPARIRDIEPVRSADYHFSLYPHDLVNHLDKSANHFRARMLLLTNIFSDSAQEIELHPPHDRPRPLWKLNGQDLTFPDHTSVHTMTGVQRAKLHPGWNTLMVKLPEMEHLWWAVINIRAPRPLRFSARRDDAETETPWTAYGPFQGAPARHNFDTILVDPLEIHPTATSDRFLAAWNRGDLHPEDYSAPFCRTLPKDLTADTDIYAICSSERVLPGPGPLVDHPAALMEDNDDWTTLHPAENADTRLLLDFGKEVVGFHEFEIDAPAGAILDCHNFEFIQRDNRINLAEGMNNSFRYICREGVQRYRTFTRRGFRYSWLSFRNFRRPIRVRFVRLVMSTYPLARGGEFACSDPMLNQIWDVGVHSVRCCSEDTYTDCPGYEQTLWVGDARNEAMIDLIANGDPRLSARSLLLSARSLDRSPIVESQIPSGWQNILTTWSFLWMRWTHEHFLFTGDAGFARHMLSFVKRNVQGMRDHINQNGLFEMVAWNLFDWAPMETPARGVVTHVQCAAVQGLRQCAQLATHLGDKKLSRDWSKFADELTAATNKHLWSIKQQAYIDCIREDGQPSKVFSQQTQTAAYISGVAAGRRAARCRSILHQAPKGFVQAGSPFFMFFLLEALVREEQWQPLIDTIRSYWGEQVAAGATAFWEMYHKNEPRLTRSHCHGWSAAPVVFLTQNLLGVQPLSPGYAKVLIAPHPGDLQWAQGRVPTPHGPIQCTWKNTPATFDLELLTPASLPIEIHLPFKGRVTLTAGKAKSTSPATLTSQGPILRLSIAKKINSPRRSQSTRRAQR